MDETNKQTNCKKKTNYTHIAETLA